MNTEGKVMPNVTRKSLLDAYRRGRRDFCGICLTRMDLGESRRPGNKDERPVLRECDFTGATLRDCTFVGSDLTGSRFARANLTDSNFARATLTACDFSRARLDFCNLNLADCNGAKFTHASFRVARLWGTDLSNTLLTGTDFSGAALKSLLLTSARAAYVRLNDTVLSDLDLSVFVNARIVKSRSPSDVDWSAVAQSLRLPYKHLKSFLVRVGMPDSVAEWMIKGLRALDPADTFAMMQSTFISYGAPDETFATALRDELQKNGVKTFLFRDDAVPGQKLHRMMSDGVNRYDRVILVCSKASLNRPGVLNEIEETLQREARDGGAVYLIPIRLDDYVFKGWSPTTGNIARAVRDRVVGDFRKYRRSRRALLGAMGPLLDALRTKRSGKT
jgi:hypothetical protein